MDKKTEEPTPEESKSEVPAPTPVEQEPAATDQSTSPATDGAAAPPPANTATPAASTSPPPNKMKKLLKIGLPILTIIAVLGLAGFGIYYFFFMKKGDGTAQNPSAPTIAEASENPQATEEGQLATPCISGYKPFTNELFSICIPKTMDLAENGVDAPDGNGKMFTFDDDVATLTVLTDYKENLNKSNCATSKVVKVSGYQAQRYLIKTEGKTAGTCTSTIKQYATLVSSGPDKPLFFIGLQKKEGSYLSDNGVFVTIDQSFFINQQ
jgi:hypothetical protein